MHGPPEMPMGRGMLLFAVLMLALAPWVSLGRGEWAASGLWYALAAFFACYGAIMSDALDRWRRLLLAIGLISGVAAFAYAVWMAGLFR